MAELESSPGVYVRVANAQDLTELATMAQCAFVSSPPQTFFSGATAPLTPDPKDAKRKTTQTKIVGITIWRPPGDAKPPSLLNALRLGLFSVVVNWGMDVMARISELVQSSEHILREGYAERKLAGTPEDAWYLQLAGVDPQFQGKGYMSILLREGFKRAPGAVFTLEATTPRARDVYKHFGFEVVKEVMVGKGKVDASGVIASGDAATGFPIYPMIRASPSQPS